MTELQLIELAGAAIGFPIVAYAIGAVVHIYIDQRHGAQLVDRYFKTTKEQIVDPLKLELKGEIQQLRETVDALELEIPTVDVAAQFEGFLRSEPGKQWARELAELAAADFEKYFVSKTTQLAGEAAKHTQDALVKLIDGAMDFGNPILNGLWAQIPYHSKIRVYNRIARVLRKSGLSIQATGAPRGAFVDAEFAEQEEPPEEGVAETHLATYAR